MAEDFVPNPDADDGTFVSKNILFDSDSIESGVTQSSGPMNEWDRAYQRKIELQTPDDQLLSAEDEVQLESAVQAGKQAAVELMGSKHRSKTESAELTKLVESGQAARDTLILANMRLAAWFARQTMDFDKQRRQEHGKPGTTGRFTKDLSNLAGGELEYGDRMQLASIGLMRAAERHDPSKGRFTTYAMYCMEAELLRAVGQEQSPLKISFNRSAEINILRRTIEDYEIEGNLDPSDEILATNLGWSLEKTAFLHDLLIAKQPVSFEQVEEAVAAELAREDRLEQTDQAEALADTLADPGVDKTVLDEAAFSEMGFRLDQALSDLNDREQRIIELRLGLEDGERQTLEEVGREFGVTRDRIRQIEAVALAKLRHPMRSRGLREFLENEDDPIQGQSAQIRLTEAQEAKLNLRRSQPTSSQTERHFYLDDKLKFKHKAGERSRPYTLKELTDMRRQRQHTEESQGDTTTTEQ